MTQHPGIIAAAIAGGSIGMAANAMNKGEMSEKNGETGLHQTGSFLGGGITGGIAGTGIGLGIGSAAYALKTILGK